MLLPPPFHNFILSVYCDLFMGFSERVNVQCSIGKIKTAGKPGGAGLSTVGVPCLSPVSMQMIWAQQVKIMQYHIFCATPGLSNESVPREGLDANVRGRGQMSRPRQWRSRPLSPHFLCSSAHFIISLWEPFSVVLPIWNNGHLFTRDCPWCVQTAAHDGPGSLRARVKAPIVIFIPLFHSNALLGRTALLFTRVKAMFLPQTRPNVKTILFWLARNSFLLPADGEARERADFILSRDYAMKWWTKHWVELLLAE